MNYKSDHQEACNIKLVCNLHKLHSSYRQNFLWELLQGAQVLLSSSLISFISQNWLYTLALFLCSYLCNFYGWWIWRDVLAKTDTKFSISEVWTEQHLFTDGSSAPSSNSVVSGVQFWDQKMIKPWMLAQNKNKLQVSRSQGCNALNFQGSLLQITLSVPTRQLSFKSYLKSRDLIKFQTFLLKIQTSTLLLWLAIIYNKNRQIQAFILHSTVKNRTFVHSTLALTEIFK